VIWAVFGPTVNVPNISHETSIQLAGHIWNDSWHHSGDTFLIPCSVFLLPHPFFQSSNLKEPLAVAGTPVRLNNYFGLVSLEAAPKYYLLLFDLDDPPTMPRLHRGRQRAYGIARYLLHNCMR